jgi:oligopeptidase B
LTAPVAARKEHITDHHGRRIDDPYAWLRDPDWQRVMREPETLLPEIRDHLNAENTYTEAVLAPIAGLRAQLVEELKARIKEDDSSVPSRDGAWAYYRRFVPGGQYPVLCRRPSADEDGANEQILLDGDKAAEGQSFFSIGGASHTTDHRLFSCAVDRNGSEYCEIGITDLETGEALSDVLHNAQGDMVWSADGRMLFYTVLDDNHRPSRVMRHRIGSPAGDDVLVYEETDPGFFLGIGKTESGRFIVIDAHDHADTAEVRLISADDPLAEPRLLLVRETGVTYDVSDHDDRLIIRTNAAGSVDFRVVQAPLEAPEQDNWVDIVPHRPGCLIRSMLVFDGHLVRLEREQALPRIVVRSLAEGEEHKISFDEEAYDLTLMPGYEYATTILRFSYSSPTTPQRVYDYDMASRSRSLRKEQEIPSGHDPDAYECRRVFAESPDGVKVPVTVLRARDTPVDGSAPMLLYGYGSYGFAMPASFSPHVFSLVDRGFVYAIAHIRGGTENGQGWHLDGKLDRKKNTFADFIAAAEHLIAEQFTAAGNIVAQGRSAGGMLMGAVANMRSDLFCGILGEVPFVDVINTMCDETLPLTPPEWVEWGDPILDPKAFEYMASYCPYTNVADRVYPNVLATGGLTDPRVTYWEPAKWAAKLRHHNTGDSNILLYMNMDAGHGGASGRFDRLKEIALSYGFALMVTGTADGRFRLRDRIELQVNRTGREIADRR